MNKWAPGLILFGAIIGAISWVTLFVVWHVVLINPYAPDYTARKIERVFLRGDPGCITWPALIGVLFGFALLGRGLFLLLRENDK